MLSDFVGDLGLDAGYLLVRGRVLSQIAFQARNVHPANETGGILIGSYRGGHIDVASSTVQQSRDFASKYRFHRRDRKHQSYASRAWRRSNGLLTYLGEWHSHPEESPSPSDIDTRSWVAATQHARRSMVFLIVGHNTFWVGYTKYEQGKCEIHRSTSFEQQ